MTSESHDCQKQERIRSLVRRHYFRNRHLTPVHDDDDLFQDAWIQFTLPDSKSSPDDTREEERSEREQSTQDFRLQHAVRKAASRAFGKLRKRQSRGSATETTLEFDPADSMPEIEIVIDLRDEIESLPNEERTVIELLRCGYEGVEIASFLGLSPQTVSRRKHNAISKLRRALNRPD